MNRTYRLAPVTLAVVTGCTLIDQTTFAPDPEPPTQAVTAETSSLDRRLPLLTVRYDVPHPDYGELLRYAIQTANQRDSGIQYDVVAVVPASGGPIAEVQAAKQGRQDAVEIMRAMIEQGVPDNRIHLGARSDAAAATREVRVYVR